MTGKLTTHILDTAHGRPAAGVRILLSRLNESGLPVELARAVTNADGRTDAPLLAGEEFVAGTYVLEFAIGEYFSDGFFDVVPVRFRVHDATSHYHVPLLCSPWSFSTYRGS